MGAKLALFGATIIWGLSFLFVKSSVDFMQPHVLLAIRFTLGFLFLSMIFYKSIKQITKDYLLKGGIIGLCLFCAYSMQTIGIMSTTPGKNAFLTSIYCVIVPFLYWILDKKKPNKYNFIAAIVSITGIGFVSLNGDLSVGRGDVFTLIGGFFYAAHMVTVGKYSKDKNPILLTLLQFGFAGLFSWIVVFFFEELPNQWNTQAITGLLYLTIFATIVALLLQNIGQKYTKPAPAAIILSLEAVFGVLFSALFYHEEITLKLMLGFILIFISIIISETKLCFTKGLRRRVPKTLQFNSIYRKDEIG